MEDITMARKFKLKIRGTALINEGTIADGKTFSEAANDWYTSVGKASLEAYFKTPVNDNSYLNQFVFADSVDKEAYD